MISTAINIKAEGTSEPTDDPSDDPTDLTTPTTVAPATTTILTTTAGADSVILNFQLISSALFSALSLKLLSTVF